MAEKKDFVFKEGEDYKMMVWVNPVWPLGDTHTCTKIRNDGKEGLFTCGTDTRWWAAAPDQFAKA